MSVSKAALKGQHEGHFPHREGYISLVKHEWFIEVFQYLAVA